AAVHGALVVVLHRRVLEPVCVLDLERDGGQSPRERLRSAIALGERSTARAAERRRRRAVLPLLDAVRGVPDHSRKPRARRRLTRVGTARRARSSAAKSFVAVDKSFVASAFQADLVSLRPGSTGLIGSPKVRIDP